MTDEPQKIARRSFVADGTGPWARGAGRRGRLLTARRGRAERLLWQIDPDKCIACDRCQTQCVLDVSAVKSVQCFALCGYCDVCTGYFPTKDYVLDTGAENQLCPTGAITRTFIEEKGGERFFEYTIDESLCIGCGKCVAGCRLDERFALFANTSRPLPQLQRVLPLPWLVRRRRLAACRPRTPNILAGRPCGRAGRTEAIGRTPPHPLPLSRAVRGSSLPDAFRDCSCRSCCLRRLATQASAGELIPVPTSATTRFPRRKIPPPGPSGGNTRISRPWRPDSPWQATGPGATVAAGTALLAIVSLAWLGFWRKGCICPIGAIENITLAVFDPTYAVPLSAVALLALPLVFTLFFGRTFCASVCPLGAVQELVAVRPVKVPLWLEHALGLVAYVYLARRCCGRHRHGLLDLPLRSIRGPVSPERRAEHAHSWRLFPGRWGYSWAVLIAATCALTVLSWGCSRVAKWHVRIPPQKCIQCRLCEDACPYRAIREPSVAPAASADDAAGGGGWPC